MENPENNQVPEQAPKTPKKIVKKKVVSGYGYGGGYGGGGVGENYVLATDFANLERKMDGINNGLCDGFYAQNTNMLNGFAGVQQTLCQGFSGIDRSIANLGYQQARVLTYMASGGLFGVGIGNGFLKQVAASESDLVFGLVSEEMGVIVAFTLAVAVGAMFIYARAITTRSRSTFYSISACCAAGLFVVQLSLNVFGATDVLPLTGVTFPFVSYV